MPRRWEGNFLPDAVWFVQQWRRIDWVVRRHPGTSPFRRPADVQDSIFHPIELIPGQNHPVLLSIVKAGNLPGVSCLWLWKWQ